MGNSALRDIAQIQEISLDELEGESAAIDAYNWLYKYVTTTVQFTDESEYTTSDGVEVPNLHGGIKGIRRFFEYDIQPVFVFDGGAHSLKQAELEDRRSAKQQAKKQAEQAKSKGNKIEAARLESRSTGLTDPMIESTMELLDALDIPYVVAPKSGESQAAFMTVDGAYDFVVSDDYDSLLFNAQRTVRNFTSSSRAYEEIDIGTTLAQNEITLEQLVDIAILCGTDYNDGVHGFGPKTSVKKIREFNDIFSLLESEGKEVEALSEIRSIFLEPDVTTDYPEPHSPQPDMEHTRKLLSEKWELPDDVVNPSLEKIEEVATQTGLGEWE